MQLASFGRRLSGRADVLPGWRQEMVEITDPEVLRHGGKTHHPIARPGRKDDSMAGTVFEITADEPAAADAHEVSGYGRVAATLASGITAWVYGKA